MANDLRIEIGTSVDITKAETQIKSFIDKYSKKTIDLKINTSESSSSGGKSSTEKSSKAQSAEMKYIQQSIVAAEKSMQRLNSQQAAYGNQIKASAKAQDALNKAKQAYNKLDIKAEGGIKEQLKYIQMYQDAVKNANVAIKQMKLDSGILDSTERQTKSPETKILDTEYAKAAKLQAQLIALENRYQEELKESYAAQSDLNKAKLEFQTLGKGSFEEQITALKNYEVAAKQAARSLRDLEQVDPSKLFKLKTDFDKMLTDNPRYTQSNQLVAQANNINNLLASGTKADFKQAKAEIAGFKSSLVDLNLTGGSALDSLGAKFKKFISWFGMTHAVMQLISLFKQMVSNVIELDTSLVELQKVSGLTGASLSSFVDDAYAVGDTLARTGKEVIDATTVFKRAGYDLQESFKLAEMSLLLTNVGDGITNVEDAASSMIAILRGFDKEVYDAKNIVDMINEVSNTAPIDASNITEGLTRSAAILGQAGNSIEQTIGLITGGFAQLRNVQWVTTGLNMISQRIRGIDEDGNRIEGLAPKIESEFMRLANIKITENGELRDTYDILSDIARVFPEMSAAGKNIEVQYLSELAAGNRHAKTLNTIVSGWADVEQAVKAASNAQGSADAENERYLNSIEGRLNKLSSSFQRLSQTTISSDFLKNTIDMVRVFVDLLDSLISKIGTLPTILTAVSAGLGIFGKKNGIFDSMNLLQGKEFLSGNNIFKTLDATSTKNASDAINTYNAAIMANVPAQDAFAFAAKGSSVAMQNYLQTLKGAPASMADFSASLGAGTIKMGLLKVGAMALNVGLTMLVSVGINLLISKLMDMINAEQKAIDKSNEMRESFQNSMNAINENLSRVEGYEEEFNKLANGVGNFGENISLSSEEYQRYLSIVNEVAGMTNTLIQGYDAEGNAIVSKNGFIEETIRLLNEQKKLEQQEHYSPDSMWESAKGSIAKYKQQIREIDKAKSELTSLFFKGTFMDEKKGQRFDFLKDVLGIDPSQFKISPSIFNDTILNGLDKLIAESQDSTSKYFGILNKDVLAQINSLRNNVDREVAKTSTVSKDFLPTLLGFPQQLSDYDNLNEASKSFLTNIINAFDITKISNKSDLDKVTNRIADLTKYIADNADLQIAIDDILKIDASSMSVGNWYKEVESGYNKIIKQMGGLLNKDEELQLRVALGLSVRSAEDPSKELSSINELFNNVRNNLNADGLTDDVLGSLTKQEIDILLDPNFVLEDGNIADILPRIYRSIDNMMATTQVDEISRIYNEAKIKTDLLNAAFKEQWETGRISAETYRNLYNQGSDWADMLHISGNELILLTDEAEAFSDVLVETAINQATLNFATQNDIDMLHALRMQLEDTKGAFEGFKEALETPSITENAFEPAVKALEVLRNGIENGATETDEFYMAMQELFDIRPSNLHEALDLLDDLFSNDEDSLDRLVKKVRELSDGDIIDPNKIKSRTGLSDDGIDALMDRMQQAGYLLANGEVTIDTLGNGLGLMSDKAVDLESALHNVYQQFQDGEITLEEARAKVIEIGNSFGVTGDQANILAKNWDRVLDGLNIDTIGTFMGIDADTQSQISDAAKSYIDEYKAAIEYHSSQGTLDELNIIDSDAVLDNFRQILKDNTPLTSAMIDEMLDRLSQDVYTLKINAYVDTVLQGVDIGEDQKQLIKESIQRSLQDDGTFNIDMFVNALIELSSAEISPNNKVKLKDVMQKYIDGEISKADFEGNIGKLNLGDLSKTIIASADVFKGLNTQLNPVGDSADDAKTSIENLGKAAKETEGKIKELVKSQFAPLVSSIGGAIGSMTALMLSAALAKSVIASIKMPNLNTAKASSSLGSSARGSGGPTIRAKNGAIDLTGGPAILGDEFHGAYEMVLSKDGSKSIYGSSGAEVVKLNAGDVVFPHGITKGIIDGSIPLLAYGTGTLPPSAGSSGSSKTSSSKSSQAKKAAKSTVQAAEDVKETIQAIFDDLRHQLEMDIITEEQYYIKLDALNKQYYKNKKEYLKEYRSNLEDVYKYWKGREEDYVSQSFDDIKHLLNMDQFTEAEYYNNLYKLNEVYYADKEEHLKEYRSNLEAIYSYEKKQQEELKKLEEERKRVEEERVKGLFSALSHRLALDQISEDDYYAQLSKLNEEYYADNEEYLDEYRSNLETLYNWRKARDRDLLNAQITLMDSIRGFYDEDHESYKKATDQIYDLQRKLQLQIQTEISRYREIGYKEDSDVLIRLKQEWYDIEKWKRDEARRSKELEIEQQKTVIDSVVRRLNKEIEELQQQRADLADEDIVGSYGYRIKLIRDEIAELRKRNAEKKKELDLEKARDELEKLRNQRTILIYRDNIGFVYEADTEAIADAEQNLKDLEFDIYIDKLTEEQEALEKELKEAQKTIDQNIKAWEIYRDKWANIVKDYQNSQDDLLAAQLLGADWESQILDKRLDILDNFKNLYIQKMQELNVNVADQLEDLLNMMDQMNTLPGFIGEVLDENGGISIYNPSGGNSNLPRPNQVWNGSEQSTYPYGDYLKTESTNTLGDLRLVQARSMSIINSLSNGVNSLINAQNQFLGESANAFTKGITEMNLGTQISIGDIYITDANNANDLANQIILSLPNALAQRVFKG